MTTPAKTTPDTSGLTVAGVIVGIVVVAAYNWMPWISAVDGSSIRFHEADAYTLSLFTKAFWAAVVGVFCVVVDEYQANVCGALPGVP